MKWVLRALREPLLQFFVLAVALFALSEAISVPEAPPEAETIVVSQQRIKSLVLIFQRTWQRPPTREELDGIVDDYVKEEIFYREALAMGLDRDDTLVRRRLRQKLEFVAEDIADAAEPTDEDLQQHLAEHMDAFRVERQASFKQVYLSRERRGETVAADAAKLLEELKSETLDAAEAGDPSLLQHLHEGLREFEIANLFGPEFPPQLLAAPVGAWVGPIESAYGVHLVLLLEKSEGRVPELDEVRDAVRRDWIALRREDSKEKFFQALLRKYDVVLEELDSSPGANAAEANP